MAVSAVPRKVNKAGLPPTSEAGLPRTSEAGQPPMPEAALTPVPDQAALTQKDFCDKYIDSFSDLVTKDSLENFIARYVFYLISFVKLNYGGEFWSSCFNGASI